MRSRTFFPRNRRGKAPDMSSIVTLTINPSLDIASETDRLLPGDKLRSSQPLYHAGGGGINVARAIRLLGGQATAVFPAGGTSGALIVDLLRRERVRCDVIPIKGATRENVHIDERETGRQFRFVMPGPALSAAEQKHCLDRVAAQKPAPAFLVASGSLPPGVAPDFYARVARLAHRLGARLVLDTSGPALKQAGHGVYLIKPSLQELRELVGHDIRTESEEEAACAGLIAEGRCEVAVLSLGERGALLATAGMHRRFRPLKVKVRSTVGAGDSMVAGIVLGLARGEDLVASVRLGIAAATAALTRPGTQLCHPEDVRRFHLRHTEHAPGATERAAAEAAPR